MMAETGTLRRTKSMKDAFNRGNFKRDRVEEEQPPLPTRSPKHTFVQVHVTSDDLAVRIPRRRSSTTLEPVQRHTWPPTPRERKPGTFTFDAPPTLVRTPWEFERSRRPASQWSRYSGRRTLSPHVFAQLPQEVLDCVLEQLKFLHTSGSNVDVRSYQNDLRAVCLQDKQSYSIAREHLYREIWLPRYGDTNSIGLALRRMRSKLALLKRTLSQNDVIASIVRQLRITANLAAELEHAVMHSKGSVHNAPALQTLRSIILACPNLEQLSGHALMTVRVNEVLFEALSSRTKLKSHTWRLPPAACPTQIRLESGYLLNFHVRCQQLESLVIWQPDEGADLGPGLISAAIRRLPCLKHLMLKCLSASDFHNGTLLMLPALESLRLERLPGVTDQGMEQLAHSRLAMSLETFIVYGLELTSLKTIQSIFANFARLKAFTLLQDTSPELNQWFSATSSNFTLKSPSLQKLHWDVLQPGSGTIILANSIAAGKFPSLRKVIVPCDYDGAIQNLCRPIQHQQIRANDIATLAKWENSASYRRSLRVSQIQAQLRIRERRKQPSFNVVIQDDEDDVQHTHVIGSYLGTVGSNIEYCLEPAIEGTARAIAHVEDVAMSVKSRAREYEDRPEKMLGLDLLF